MKYSIVIPVYNEQDSIAELHQEIVDVMGGLCGHDFEVIYVDDCSDDQSAQLLSGFKAETPEQVKIITLSVRSGQTRAMRLGLDQARGDVVFTLDADLQNDPHDIPHLLIKMAEGYDVVCGWRKSRQDRLLKAVLSKFGNMIQRLLTGLSIHDVSCTLRAYKSQCVPHITLKWEGQHRFIPLCLSLQGYRVGEIVSHHRVRKYGTSKYSHKRILKVVLDFFRILKSRGR